VASSIVHVAAGTYVENIILKDGVEVLGAGADVTTIDGGGAGSVVTAIGVGSETVLDGFTITNGSVPTWGDGGGGMYNLNSSVTVLNCLFSNNLALSDGGGMYNFDSSPTVTNCTFSNNSATAGWGGGMRNHNSSPTVTNCVFSENSAALAGGGMYNYASSPMMIDCTLSGNLAERGGGMFNTVSSSPTVTNCTFIDNSTVDTGAAITFSGGGMFNDSSSEPIVTDCTFSNNTAIGYGGGMYNEGGSPSVTNCYFFGNSGTTGGGMYNYNASTIVTNCILYNNSVTPFGGGGMSNHSSSPMIVNCTFSHNSAAKWGDGMFNFESSPTVFNCILWGNGEEIFWFGSPGPSASVTYCDVQGGHSGVGNIDADPAFVDTSSDDYHLQAGSPCIDTGTDTGAPTEDIEGNPRPIDGDIIPGTVTDMGAYEFVPPPPVADFSGDPTAGVAPLKIDFTDESIGVITSCSWDFGDTGSSNEQNPSHTYNTAGVYTVSLTVTGPGGTNTKTKTDYITVNPALAVEATVDFAPDTLNKKSKGKWVTAYIELEAGYDANDIDVSTILLNDTVSAKLKPVAVGDHDSNGISDLMVKFDRALVQELLTAGNEVEVTVSGELTDDTPFEGTDTIRVIE